MSELTLVIAVIKKVGRVLGGFITYLAVKAARRTDSASMRTFALTAMVVTYWLLPQVTGRRLRLYDLAVV